MSTKGTQILTLTDTDSLFGRPLRSGDVVAALTLYSGGLTWENCVTSLLLHTTPDVPLVVFDDAGPSGAAVGQLQAIETQLGREVHYYRQPRNLGVVGNLNSAFDMLAPADVIVLNSDIIVGPEWADRLIIAARSRTDIATATALSTNATIFTVRGRESWMLQPPSVSEFEQVAVKVRDASAKVYPFVPVATSFCTYFARRALNVVGGLDEEYSPGYGEEVDYSLRCVAYGFNHIAVDDVYVYHATGESFGAVEKNERKVDNDLLVSRRYPYWDDWISGFESTADSPLERVKHYTSAVIHGITIAIDAELIHENLTGTFEVSVALSRRLALNPQVRRVVWVASAELVAPLRDTLAGLKVDTIDVKTLADLNAAGTFIDVAFRPCQDFSGSTWPQLSGAGHRNVIWTLDLIATMNPHYAENFEDFARINRVARQGWENADAIAVLTPHVRQTLEAYYSGLDPATEVFILPSGAPEHAEDQDVAWAVGHPGIEALGDDPYVLILGTNFLHKNIPWIMRVGLQVKSLGWPGRFVFAGPTPTRGHSGQLEHDLVELTEADCFTFLGRVSDPDKRRLIGGAALVISPPITEGWGMIPSEAIAYGSTPVATHGGGLRDISPDAARVLGLVDDREDADTIFELLIDDQKRRLQQEVWAAKVEEFQWGASAQTLVDALMRTLLRRRRYRDAPVTPSDVPSGMRYIATQRALAASTRILPVGSRPRRMLKRVFSGLLP